MGKPSGYDHLRAARLELPYPDPVWPPLAQVLDEVEKLIEDGTPPLPEEVFIKMGIQNWADTTPEFWERLKQANAAIGCNDSRARQVPPLAYSLDSFESAMRAYEGEIAWGQLYGIGMGHYGDTNVTFWEELSEAAKSFGNDSDAEKAQELVSKKRNE